MIDLMRMFSRNTPATKSRAARPRCVLDERAVCDIRERYAAGESAADIADRYGVHRQTVWDVASGKSWRSADGPIATNVSRRRMRQMTVDKVIDIRNRVAAGESCAAVARYYGVSRCAVHRVANRMTYGWIDAGARMERSTNAPSAGKLTTAQVREIRRVCPSGVSYSEMARRLGVTPSAVADAAKRVTYKWIER